MISVAMALYNSTRFIREQLDSIREQTALVDEVIMVDDCSTDDTVEVVQKYIEKYELKNWKIIRHDVNKGYICTFFDAIEKCDGDIIILCDHDDIWYPNKVRVIKNVFSKKPDVLMLASSFDQIDECGNVVSIKPKHNRANNNLIRRKVRHAKLNKMTIYDVVVFNVSPGCTCAINKKIKSDLLSHRYKLLPHDWTLAVLSACQGGLYYLDKAITKYRIYDQNTIGLGHENRYENRRRIVRNNYEEKKAILDIVNINYGIDSDESKYCSRVLKVFEMRSIAINQKNYWMLFKALIKSYGMNSLYESILMDLITMIKS